MRNCAAVWPNLQPGSSVFASGENVRGNQNTGTLRHSERYNAKQPCVGMPNASSTPSLTIANAADRVC